MHDENICIDVPDVKPAVVKRWVFWESNLDKVITLCIIANFINSADRVIMPISINGLARENSYSLIEQGWILSAFPAGYISSQIIGSCAGSQVGGRRLLFSAVLLWSLSTLLVPIVAPSFHLLIFSRVMLGIGEGLGLPTIYHIFAQKVCVEDRSVVFSYLAAASSIGQTFAALVCPYLAWELPFYVFGFSGIYWCLLWIKYSKDLSIPVSDKLLFQKDRNPLRHWDRFLFLTPLMAIYCAHFCMNWTAYVIMHWLPTYLRITLSAKPSSISLAAFPYLLNSVACVGVGYLVDFLINSRRVTLYQARVGSTVLGLVLPALFIVAFAFVKSLPLAILFVSLSMAALAFNSAGHLSNHADVAPKYAGITFAISNTIATLPGMTVGPFTAQLVLESSGRWWPSFILASALNFVGAIIYVNFASVQKVI